MKVIDMRVRPPFGMFLQNGLYSRPEEEIKSFPTKFGIHHSKAAITKSMDDLLAEMDEANVERAVAPTRPSGPLYDKVDNSELIQLQEKYPGRFIAVVGVEKFADQETFDEIEKYVQNGPGVGIIIEPAFGPNPGYAHDERIFPLYEYCQERNIPMMITWGGLFARELGYYDPAHIDHVALTFPKLKIALCHGGWPYASENCQIAFFRENVYLSPDLYMVNAPGSNEYIAGANYMLSDKIIFGSAYPLLSIKDCVNYTLNCGIREEVLPGIMHDNALKFFNID